MWRSLWRFWRHWVSAVQQLIPISRAVLRLCGVNSLISLLIFDLSCSYDCWRVVFIEFWSIYYGYAWKIVSSFYSSFVYFIFNTEKTYSFYCIQFHDRNINNLIYFFVLIIYKCIKSLFNILLIQNCSTTTLNLWYEFVSRNYMKRIANFVTQF